MMRWLRRLLFLFGGIAALVVGAFLLLVLALETPAARRWAVGAFESALGGALDAQVQVGSVGSLGLDGVELRAIRIEHAKQGLATIPRLSLALTRPGLVPPFVSFRLEMEDPRLSWEETAAGWWPAAGSSAEGSSLDMAGLSRQLRLFLSWIDHVTLRVRGGQVRLAPIDGAAFELTGLRLRARLSGGALRAPRLQLGDLAFSAGSGSAVDAHGSLEVAEGGRLRLAARLAPFRGVDFQPLLPELADDASGEIDLAVRGSLEEPAATMLWRANAAGARPSLDVRLVRRKEAPQGWQLTGQLDDFRPASLLREAPSAVLQGNASLSFGADGGVLPQSVQVYLHQLRLASIPLEWLRLDAAGAGSELRGRLEAAAAEDAAQLQADFDLDLEADGRLRTTVDAALTDPVKLGLGDSWAGTKLQFQVQGDAGSLFSGRPRGSLDVRFGNGSVRGLPLRRGEARFTLEPSMARLSGFDFAVGRGRLRGEGSWRLDPPSTGDLSPQIEAQLAGDLDLRVLPDSAGLLPLQLAAQGAPGDLAATFALDAVQEIAVGALNLSGRLQGSLSGIGSTQPGGKASFRGPIRTTEAWGRWGGGREADATLDLDWQRGAKPAVHDRVAFSLDLDSSLDDRHAGVGGVFEGGAGKWQLQLERLRLSPDTRQVISLAGPAGFRVERGLVAVENLGLSIAGGVLEASGRVVAAADGASDLRLAGRDLQLAEICRLVRIPTACTGVAALDARVEQRDGEPFLAAKSRISDLELAGARYGVLRARLDGTPGTGIAINLDLAGPAGEELEANLEVPTRAGTTFLPDFDGALRGAVEADGFRLEGLRILTGQSLRRLGGVARSRIVLGGTLGAPTLDGKLAVEDLVLSLAAAGAVYEGGRIELAFDADRLEVRELVLADGAIRAHGTLGLGRNEDLQLVLTLEEATVVERPEATVVAGGELVLRGRRDAPELDGKLAIRSARLRPSLNMGSAAARDSSILVVHSPRDGVPWADGFPPPGALRRPAASTPSGDTLFDRLAVRVAVDVDGPVEIRRHDAHLRLGGALELGKKPSGPLRVDGKIKSQGGWYNFQGRRLQVVRADLSFEGRSPIDPSLDVEAQYRTPGYLVTAAIRGRVTEPQLNLSSDPALSQSDVLAVLLFGEPASDLNSEQGNVLQQQALGLLASYIAPELQRSVLDTFGWTSLTFRMPTGTAAGSLGIGRYFGEDVFVSISQDFGGPTGGTARQLEGLVGSSVTVQFRLTPGLVLQGASSTEGESTVDLIWNRRY